MPTFHRFDAEMAELVEERDVTNSIKENQWTFLDGPTKKWQMVLPTKGDQKYVLNDKVYCKVQQKIKDKLGDKASKFVADYDI